MKPLASTCLRVSYTILTFLVFTSCSTNKNCTIEQLIGKYQWNEIYGVGSIMELKEDQTFEYHWQSGLIGATTSGTWEKEGTKIILNSELQLSEDGKDDFEIIRTERNGSDSLLVKVIGSDNEIVPFAACILKEYKTTLTGVNTDLEGEAKLPFLEVADSLIISFVGYKTIRHKLDHSISSYVFKMKEEVQYYEYFTNETWIYKNERLYDPSIKKRKYVKKNYYEKVE